MLLTAMALGGGCASTPPAEAATTAAPDAEATPKTQPKVLERSAPTAQEIETPLQGGGNALPVLAEGTAPVGEGGTPRSNPPAVPAARPGESPVVAEVIDMPTEALHGGAFPGVGTTPKTNGNGKSASGEVAQRIAAIEKQLGELREASAKTPATAVGPDPKAFEAVQARLDALSSKLDEVATRPAAAPQSTGVAPERVEAVERALAELRQVAATRDDVTATAKERALAEQAYGERIAALERQLSGLDASVAKTAEGARSKGVAADELAKRMGAVEQEIAALRTTPQAPSPTAAASPDALAAVQARLEEIADKLAVLEARQGATPTNTGVPVARVESIEREIAALQQDVATAPKSTNADPSVVERLAALEAQIDSLAAALEKPGNNDDSISAAAFAARLDAMQQQLDAAQQGWSNAKAAPTANSPELQAKIEALDRVVEQMQQEQAKRPAGASVPETRFAQIEQQIAGLQKALDAQKTDDVSTKLDDRFTALEEQLEGLRAELATQSQALAKASAGVPGADGSVQAALQPSSGGYLLGAGDKVEFQSFNDEKISREELVIRFDGFLSLPLIPDVQVANLTRAEAEARIRDEYRNIFRDPQIALIVREATSKNFTIVGDIEKPGVYPYTQATSLIEAISLAGGLRRRSSSSSVGGFVGVTGQLTKSFIVRNINGQREVLQYDLRGLGKSGAHDSQVPIQYGDLIYVPEGVNLVYLLGESRNPVIVELTEGMKLLQLLSLSGGFDASTARLNGVVLMRQTDENNTRVLKLNVKEILRTGKDIELVPGDIVYIPRKRLIALQEFVQRFTGTISPVLDLYTSAVDAYYAVDLQRALLDDGGASRTLETLQDLEDFGSSTANIVDLFRRP